MQFTLVSPLLSCINTTVESYCQLRTSCKFHNAWDNTHDPSIASWTTCIQCVTLRRWDCACGGDQGYSSMIVSLLKLSTSTSVSTCIGDHQRRPSAVNLSPIVGVDLNLWPTVYIAKRRRFSSVDSSGDSSHIEQYKSFNQRLNPGGYMLVGVHSAIVKTQFPHFA